MSLLLLFNQSGPAPTTTTSWVCTSAGVWVPATPWICTSPGVWVQATNVHIIADPTPPAGATSIYDARALPILTDLNPQSTWPDMGPETHSLTAGPNVPLYRAAGGPNNSPFVEYGGASLATYHEINTVSIPVSDAAPITVGGLYRPTTAVSASYIFAGFQSTTRHDVYLANTRRLNYVSGVSTLAGPVLFPSFPPPWSYFVAVFRGTTATLYSAASDGVANTTAGASTLAASTGWRFGAPFVTPPALNTRYIGGIAELRVHRGVDVGPALVSYFRARLGLAP